MRALINVAIVVGSALALPACGGGVVPIPSNTAVMQPNPLMLAPNGSSELKLTGSVKGPCNWTVAPAGLAVIGNDLTVNVQASETKGDYSINATCKDDVKAAGIVTVKNPEPPKPGTFLAKSDPIYKFVPNEVSPTVLIPGNAVGKPVVIRVYINEVGGPWTIRAFTLRGTNGVNVSVERVDREIVVTESPGYVDIPLTNADTTVTSFGLKNVSTSSPALTGYFEVYLAN